MSTDIVRASSDAEHGLLRRLVATWGYPGVLALALALCWQLTVAGYAVPVPVLVANVFGSATVLALQLLMPRRYGFRGWKHGLRLDLMHGLISNAGMNLLISMTALGGLYALQGQLRELTGGGIWPTALPLGVQLVVSILIADIAHYTYHRALHRHPLLWRFHAIHHVPDAMHALSAGRDHPLGALAVYMVQMAPSLVLGASDEVLALLTVFIAVNGVLQHSDVDFARTPLDRVLATANVHRYHHSTDPEVGESNYGGNTMLWDQLLGTYHAPGEERGPTRTGLYDTEIPDTWLGQVALPFAWGRLARPKAVRVEGDAP